MSSNQLDVLRDRLYSEADATLREHIRQQLRPSLSLLGDLVVTLQARDPLQSAQPITVEVTREQLAQGISNAIFADRMVRARSKYVAEFLKRVEESES